MLLQFPAMVDEDGIQRFKEQWVGVFLAFQSQSWHTDDTTGHTLDTGGGDVTGATGDIDGRVRVIAALVNPMGNDVGLERVTLLNVTPSAIDMQGWEIADKNKRRTTIPTATLDPGDTLVVHLSGAGAQLSNKGGIITLLDPDGLKVSGVSYTRVEARQQGWTLAF